MRGSKASARRGVAWSEWTARIKSIGGSIFPIFPICARHRTTYRTYFRHFSTVLYSYRILKGTWYSYRLDDKGPYCIVLQE